MNRYSWHAQAAPLPTPFMIGSGQTRASRVRERAEVAMRYNLPPSPCFLRQESACPAAPA